ncbi:uncharacterized protein LOC117332633 isoform X2 [Pecten maximus]|uniref:uncharacterized protein LOC117332633 isoform X2 n=2 Tax=Pecten maximus TaxID=6579 RepID=UPI0014580C89|nr:uncharacterized protein LOC117332633 isoform X2 [Pecten maximus]
MINMKISKNACYCRQFQTCKRETKDVKKKYFNTKQRAKAKLDGCRYPATGGGPPPESPSPAEELIIAATGTRPGMKGITNGIDSDILPVQPITVTETQREDYTSSDCQATLSCTQCTSTTIQSPVTYELTSTILPTSDACTDINEPTKKKQKTSLASLTEENLMLDNQRLTLEIKRIEEETKKIQMEQQKLAQEKSVLDLKAAYWTFKLQNEFEI